MDEPELARLVYKKYSLEDKSPTEIAKDLQITEYKARKIIDNINQYLTIEDKKDIRKYILDSVDQIKEDIEEMRGEIKDLIERAKAKEADATVLVAIEKWIRIIEICLKRLGELKTGFTSITTDSVSITQLQVVAEKLRERMWDENKAEFKDGAIVLTEPRPEVVDNLIKYRKKMGAARNQSG